MPVTQGLTRANIRQRVCFNLAGARFVSSTATGGSTTTIVDTSQKGGTDEHKGKWGLMTGGTAGNIGLFRQVTAFVTSTSTFTISPALPSGVANGDTYELLPEDFTPTLIHSLINQAIDYATGKAYDPEEDVSLHLHPDERRYVVPTNIAVITKLERRVQHSGIQIDPCESGWTEQTNVTQAFDSTIKRAGNNSLRLIVAAGAAAGDIIASKTISSLDVSKYDTLEFWIRCSAATAAGDMTLRLLSGSATITFSIPALVADT